MSYSACSHAVSLRAAYGRFRLLDHSGVYHMLIISRNWPKPACSLVCLQVRPSRVDAHVPCRTCHMNHKLYMKNNSGHFITIKVPAEIYLGDGKFSPLPLQNRQAQLILYTHKGPFSIACRIITRGWCKTLLDSLAFHFQEFEWLLISQSISSIAKAGLFYGCLDAHHQPSLAPITKTWLRAKN